MNGSAFQSAFFRIFLEKLSLPEVQFTMNFIFPSLMPINITDTLDWSADESAEPQDV